MSAGRETRAGAPVSRNSRGPERAVEPPFGRTSRPGSGSIALLPAPLDLDLEFLVALSLRRRTNHIPMNHGYSKTTANLMIAADKPRLRRALRVSPRVKITQS